MDEIKTKAVNHGAFNIFYTAYNSIFIWVFWFVYYNTIAFNIFSKYRQEVSDG